MNSSLTKYLSEVFRNDVREKTSLETKQSENNIPHLNDRKNNPFIVDGKYTLHLDEII
jgi:hypothetical protein